MTATITHERADYMARCLVNGTAKNLRTGTVEPVSGAWGPRFASPPWAIQSDAEGWGLDLRTAVIAAARRRIRSGRMPKDIAVEDLMPSREMVGHWRRAAEQAREAARWRANNPHHRALRGMPQIDAEDLLRRLGIERPE